MALVAAGYENFIGGQLSSVPTNELNPNQLSLCENAVVTERDRPGILKKRRGHTKHWDESGTFGPVLAIHNFLDAAGVEELLFAVESGADTQIRQRTGATSSSLVHTFVGLTGKVTTLLTSATDFAILATEDGTYQRLSAGGAVSTINPPAGMDTGIIAAHDGRLWGSDSVIKNKLFFSAVSNEDDWTTQDNSGFLTMKMPADIKGVVSTGRSGLLVCGEFSTILVTGDDFQTYRQFELSDQIGCKSYKSMIPFGNFSLFMSHEGVMAVSDAGMEKISLPVEDVIDAMTDAELVATRAFRWKEFYVLIFSSAADSVTNGALVFDTRFGVWVTFTNQPFEQGTSAKDQTVFVASNTDGLIFTFDDGTTDDGTDITMTVQTRGMDFGRFFTRKVTKRAYYQSNKPGVTTNLGTQLLIDGTLVGSVLNYDLNQGEDDRRYEDSNSGRIIQIQLTNSGTTDVVELRSIVLLADMLPAGEVV